MTDDILYVAGVDVQIERGLAFCVLTRDADFYCSGWIDVHTFEQAAHDLRDVFWDVCAGDVSQLSIGLDAPRMPLPNPRKFFWEKKNKTWRSKHPSEKGYGRHCEVMIKALNLGNIQWTPTLENAPEWMKLGFILFEGLTDFEHVYEVFPSAAYRMFNQDTETRMTIPLAHFIRGPKDMLDAATAALSVLEFERGFGMEIGGGDGFGTIVLPRPIEIHSAVSSWPRAQDE